MTLEQLQSEVPGDGSGPDIGLTVVQMAAQIARLAPGPAAALRRGPMMGAGSVAFWQLVAANDIEGGEEYLARWSLLPEDSLVYACGHPGMIEDVKERLLPRGYAVEEERFWKED